MSLAVTMSIVPYGTSLAVTHKRLDGAGLNINCHASGPSSEPDTLPTENMAHTEGSLNWPCLDDTCVISCDSFAKVKLC